MQSFQKVEKGQKTPIIASEWNAVREAAVKVLNDEATPQSVAQGGRNKYVVLVKNDQPELVPAFGVLSVTGPVHVNQDLFDQHVQFVENWIEVKSGAPTGEENEILCVVQRRSQEKLLDLFGNLILANLGKLTLT